MLSFDIIMPHYGRSDYLQKSLDAIQANTLPACFNRLLLIENGGHFGAERLSQQYRRDIPIHYFYSEKASLSNARNIGISNSESDFLLFLDSDVRPVEGALQSYACAFTNYGDRYFYGGPLYPEFESPPPAWLLDFLPWSVTGNHLGEVNKTIDEALFLGGNFAVPRSVFNTGGLFEGPCAEGESGGGVGEETRLQERLLREGYKGLYVSGGGIIHPIPENGCDKNFVLKRQYRHGFTRGELAAKEEKFKRICCGAPFFYWKEFARSIIHLPMYLNPMADRSTRFSALLDYHTRKAMIKGFRNTR